MLWWHPNIKLFCCYIITAIFLLGRSTGWEHCSKSSCRKSIWLWINYLEATGWQGNRERQQFAALKRESMLLFYSHQVEHIHKNVYYMLLSKKFHVPWELCKWHQMFLLCNERRRPASPMSVRIYLEAEFIVNQGCCRAVFRQLCILSNTPLQVRLNQRHRPSTLLLTVLHLRHWVLAQKARLTVKACYLLTSQGMCTHQERSDHHKSPGK